MDLVLPDGAAPPTKYKNTEREREKMRIQKRNSREKLRRLAELKREQEAAKLRRSERLASTAAKARVQELDGKPNVNSVRSLDAIAAGLVQCVKGRTDQKMQKKLCGTFFRWQPDGLDRMVPNVGLFSDARRMMVNNGRPPTGVKKFTCYLNRNYGRPGMSLKQATWIPWVAVLPSPGKDFGSPGQDFGLFAARDFRRHDFIGVYMGRSCSKEENASTHLENPYVLKGVANAGGGVDSGHPALLGMHFMNHAASDDKRNNAFVVADTGAVVARKYIVTGTEILFDYGIGMAFV